MDEDPIPPHPFCSAPPHSVPPPPLLLPSSITPSCAKYGEPQHRSSGRSQAINAQSPEKPSHTNSKADQKPSTQNPSPPKRQRLIQSMVQESQSKRSQAGSVLHEEQKKDGFGPIFTAEDQNRQRDEESQPGVSATGNITEHVVDSTTQDHHVAKSNMETCENSAFEQTGENPSSPKGWLIGPLIQTFKSKISSFSEIVWSPAKLFKPNNDPDSTDFPDKLIECDQEGDEPAHVESTGASQLVQKSETPPPESDGNEQRLSEDTQTAKHSSPKYYKRLVFEVDVPMHKTEQRDESAIWPTKINASDSVPLQDSPKHSNTSSTASQHDGCSILQPSINFSSMDKSDEKSAVERPHKLVVQLKTLPRKRTGNRSDLKKVVTPPVIPVKNGASDPVFNEGNLSKWSSIQVNKVNGDKSLQSSVLNTQLSTDNSHSGGTKNVDSVENCVEQSLWENTHDIVHGIVRSTADTEQLKCELIPDSGSATGLGRSKRGQKGTCHSQNLIRPKKFKANVCSGSMHQKVLVNLASDSGIVKAVRPQREVLVTNGLVEVEDTSKPIPRTVTSRANRKGKVGQDTLLKTESSDVIKICSLDKSCGSSEKDQKSSRSNAKLRPEAKSRLGKLDVNVDSMDLETTVAITSVKDDQEGPLLEMIVHNDKKPSTNKSKKALKRKSPTQSSSVTEVESTLNSPVSSTELTPTDLKSSTPVTEETLKTTNRTTTKSKSGYKGAVKCSGSEGTQKTQHCTVNLLIKKEGKNKDMMNPLYFEITPFESSQQFSSSSSTYQLNSEQLNNKCTEVTHQNKNNAVVSQTVIPDSGASNPSNNSVSRSRSHPRAVITNPRPRRSDKGRRKASGSHKGEDKTELVTMDRADLSTHSLGKKNLLRSYSCPEIPFLHPHDTLWTTTTLTKSPHLSKSHTSHLNLVFQTPPPPNTHKFAQRTRRHTVCSLEVEREIAPLCLRKEVYPTRRSAPIESVNWQTSPNIPHSPSSSLSALANYFLSSPLAFLSKRAHGRGAAASRSSSSHVSSPSTSSPSFTSPLSSTTRHHPEILQRSDTSHPSESNSSEQVLECETEKGQGIEEDEECEDISSSSQEYEDAAFREEKALSDSELKIVQKHEDRGKVSSIRIRKALPKPQNNLTPMGLPKPIRLKKKQFSLEEIYTNKNFSKPPESRLETIFEVPLYRRNGSESLFGQRRVKRFLEFLDVGEVRKPKKPLVGVGKVVTTSSRTRRGGYAKKEPVVTVQDVDSLLCAKLDQLNLWLIHDQKGR
ncbi:uncharacterized protein prr14 isoform X2 [Cynoglossus semilaevis]|nr:uncharacterized protein LOC103392675 isoform X2 [Cynoglossus semilaevis]